MKKTITAICLMLAAITGHAQYTDAIELNNYLAWTPFKEIQPFEVFNKPTATALTVEFIGGLRHGGGVRLEWNIYHIDTTHTAPDSLGVVTYTYNNVPVANGEVMIEGDDLATFYEDSRSRFYLVAAKKGFNIR